MCEVLFVTPSFEEKIYDECMGTLLLATIVKQKGINAEILRFWQIGSLDNYERFLQNAIDIIRMKHPRIVCFYMRCDTDVVMLNIAHGIKKTDSEIYVILGGPQSSLTARDLVDEIDYIDFICKGEGETTIYPILDALLNDKSYQNIPGLVWKQNGIIYENPDVKLVENLDDNPMIDYSLIPIKFEQSTKNIWTLDNITLDAGRGCPYGCTYCSTKTFWKRKYRLKTNKKLIEEIIHAINETGCRHFLFNHDLFTADRRRIESFCNELIKNRLDVKWTCSSRVDTIDEELILLMKKAGMEKVFFGVETGSKRMQKMINKNIDVEKVIALIKFLGKNGIFSTTSFIYGFPEESEEDIEDTLKLIIELLGYPFNQVITHLLAIETGTEMFEKYKSDLVFSAKYSDVTEGFGRDYNMNFIIEHPKLFPHFLEYHTDLRDELEYIPHFVGVFSRFYHTMYYMYAYFHEKKGMKFYRDFVSVNSKKLAALSKTRALKDLLKNPELLLHNLLAKYEDNCYYEVIKELLRFETDRFNMQVNEVCEFIEIYNFDYLEVMNKSDLKSVSAKKSQICLKKNNESDMMRINLLKYI